MNSLKRLNGGLVITKSACCNNSIDSALRKSPSPSKGVHSFFLFCLSCNATSFKLNSPSPSMSPTEFIINLLAVTFGRPFFCTTVSLSPNRPNCVLATGEGL